MKKGWWIKYSVLTIVMAVVWLLCLNSVPANDPSNMISVGFTCAIPPLTYIMLFLGFVINDLRRR